MNTMETIKKILDEANVEYTKDNNSFDLEDSGGTISVLDGKVYFVYSNAEPSIPADHAKLTDWVKAYIDDGETFGRVVEATERDDLTSALFMGGTDDIEEFLGYEIPDEDDDVTANRIEQEINSMSREEFVEAYRKYVLA